MVLSFNRFSQRWETHWNIFSKYNITVSSKCRERWLNKEPFCLASVCKSYSSKTSLFPGSRILRARPPEPEFFFSVIGSTTQKRDTRAFLNRFQDSDTPTKNVSHNDLENKFPQNFAYAGVNLSQLYTSKDKRLNHSTIKQINYTLLDISANAKSFHVAVMKIKTPQALTDDTMEKVALTLAQISRLDLKLVIVLDLTSFIEMSESSQNSFQNWRQSLYQEAIRLSSLLHRFQCISIIQGDCLSLKFNDDGENTIECSNFTPILKAIRRKCLPIILPIAWDFSTCKAQSADPDETILAIIRMLKNLQRETNSDTGRNTDKTERWIIDRIILLDPLGGIPRIDNLERSHVLINLKQEYESILTSLLRVYCEPLNELNHESRGDTLIGITEANEKRLTFQQHAKNLKLIRAALSDLELTASGLLVSPYEVAEATKSSAKSARMGVGTRHYANPLIHNLLTGRPLVSCSLPSERKPKLSFANDVKLAVPSKLPLTLKPMPVTFIKYGIPLSIIPEPGSALWAAPGPEGSSVDLLKHPKIDINLLVDLIEDSFGRKLDTDAYFESIRHKFAGIVFADNYEGAAILTWENPTCKNDSTIPLNSIKLDRDADNSRSILRNYIPPVPYLDKFAVRKRGQGTNNLADMMFNVLVNDCFPNGMVWRSRNTNIVNKWYFERCNGSFRLPDSIWTVFWTGNLTDGAYPFGKDRNQYDNYGIDNKSVESSVIWLNRTQEDRLADYIQICHSIPCFWKT